VTTPIGRQQRQCPLAFGREQAFGQQLRAQCLNPRQQRALAGIFQAVDNELVFRPVGIGADPPSGDHLDPVFGLEGEARHCRLPNHRFQLRARILQREVDMAGGVALQFGDLAAHADATEAFLQRAADGAREFADRIFRDVRRCAFGNRVHRPSLC